MLAVFGRRPLRVQEKDAGTLIVPAPFGHLRILAIKPNVASAIPAS